jgi:hypothetical protein
VNVEYDDNVKISFPNPHAKLVVVDLKSKVRHSLG